MIQNPYRGWQTGIIQHLYVLNLQILGCPAAAEWTIAPPPRHPTGHSRPFAVFLLTEEASAADADEKKKKKHFYRPSVQQNSALCLNYMSMCVNCFPEYWRPPAERPFKRGSTKPNKQTTHFLPEPAAVVKQRQTMTGHPGAGFKRLHCDSGSVHPTVQRQRRSFILDSHFSPCTSLVIALDMAWHLKRPAHPRDPQRSLFKMRQNYETNPKIYTNYNS